MRFLNAGGDARARWNSLRGAWRHVDEAGLKPRGSILPVSITFTGIPPCFVTLYESEEERSSIRPVSLALVPDLETAQKKSKTTVDLRLRCSGPTGDPHEEHVSDKSLW